MNIELHRIKIRDVVHGYTDSQEEGVTAYGGRLNIRPKYQREFVYTGKQRDAVIDTVRKGFPLNVMYWMVNDDGNYEVLDGQQRTISIAQYVAGDFSVRDGMYDMGFHNLTHDEQEKILDYELMIYFCEGTDKERLEWFKTINIAGEKLTDQELRNAVYTGPWLSDAKLKFSKTHCVAYLLASDGGALLTGSPIRQEYLETALSWINNGEVADYMATHQHEQNADELWQYFQRVVEWARATFPVYRGEMKHVPWGPLYNEFHDAQLDPQALEAEVKKLMQDDDVTSRPGIYMYVLTRKEKYLSVRAFDIRMKRAAYERQNGICPDCKGHYEFEAMEGDHITPWVAGGKTTAENCMMRCRECNRRKSDS
ncbi:DUF262 domain-containing protein [Candidatus Saccharibacteria bacterium]|nr:MAG: DUF262 domain-containing protein [Candidatus Saccharibacteria bacterium]